MADRSIVVFDLGGVLVDWNPRYLYRKLFGEDDAAMEHFLANICTSEWNSQQDAGRSFAEGCALLKSQHPNYAEFIDAWFGRHHEMVAGPIPGSVEILAELRAREIPLYALSNWSAETFPAARRRFDFLQWFRGILLSGEVRLIKPDRRIFQLFLDTFGIDASQTIYVDDLLPNVEAAKDLGMHGVLFTGPAQLRLELAKIEMHR
ncbi:MAG: HAD family phosphatase [Candidatus Sulfotelmatobacter sp.]